MCGITGWITSSSHIKKNILEGMTDRLAHRGPDGKGIWISNDAMVGFGHRRLSIIDLSPLAGQPMVSLQTGLVLTFNGEIYNHREIRTELENKGILFQTDHSDTETLLEAIGYWGVEGALARLIGMFSFAVFDPEKRCVYLARDHVGIKPLYICQLNEGWLFASEAKALFAHPGVEKALDLDAFSQYLTFRFVPAPRSLFKGIQKVGAGELWQISLDQGIAKRWHYWKPLETPALDYMSRGEALDKLECLLESSLRYRLGADVPVGLFLSGGVDSSLILKLAQESDADALHTYTITYPGFEKYDESSAARFLAKSSASIHHEVPANDLDFAELMGQVAYYQDEPIAAPVCLPVFLLSRAARETGVPVVLTGEGADELFIGYGNWLRLRDIEKWNRYAPDLPSRPARRFLRSIAGALLPNSARSWDILDRIAKGQPLFWGGAMDFGRRERDLLLGPEAKQTDIQDDFEEVISPVLDDFLRSRPAYDVTGWMTYLDLRYRLPELMLPRLDKMGMAHSVEGRVPLLDHRIVEFTLTLPPELHEAAGHIGKRLLKEVASRRLPKKLVYRHKKGFQAPVAEWKDSAGGRVYLETLRRFAKRTGLFDTHTLESVLARKGSRLYFNLVNFMLWYITFIDNPVEDCPITIRKMHGN